MITHSTSSFCVIAMLSFKSAMPSEAFPLPSIPAHWPTLLVSQSNPDAFAHFIAMLGFPIFARPSKFWHWTNFHHRDGGSYFATQSCCTFPAHSSGPCKHFIPNSGSSLSILDLDEWDPKLCTKTGQLVLCNVYQREIYPLRYFLQNMVESVFAQESVGTTAHDAKLNRNFDVIESSNFPVLLRRHLWDL